MYKSIQGFSYIVYLPRLQVLQFSTTEQTVVKCRGYFHTGTEKNGLRVTTIVKGSSKTRASNKSTYQKAFPWRQM